MREALKRLTGESLVYGLGQVSGRAVQLLLVPVLTRALSRGAFGVGELVIAYMQTAALVLVFGMDGALARFFYHEPDRAARVRMVSTSFVFRAIITVTVAALGALLARPLAQELIGSEAYRKYLRIGAATLPWTLVVMFANDVLRVTFQPWKFIVLNVVQTALVGGVSLWLVLGRHLGVAGVLYGRLAGDGASALLGLVLIRHALRPRFDRAVLRRMLAYGLPLVPVAFAYGAIGSVDRYVLQRTRSLEDVAVYAVAIKFFSVVSMGVAAFQLAYGPFAYARADAPEAPRLFARVLSAFVALGSLAALAVSLFAPEALVLLVPASYRDAAWPAAWLAFAAVAQGAYTVVSIGIGLALRTSLLGWTAGAAALVAVGANVALAPALGPAGAAMATTAGYATSAALAYVAAQRVHPLPYGGARAAGVWAGTLAVGLAAQRLAPPGAAGVGIKLGVLVVAATLLLRLGLWREGAHDRDAVRATGG
ncbi:MAG TPA: oligosaccharide flippase family protein [Candidatus Eisenbacteria bacterium]